MDYDTRKIYKESLKKNGANKNKTSKIDTTGKDIPEAESVQSSNNETEIEHNNKRIEKPKENINLNEKMIFSSKSPKDELFDYDYGIFKDLVEYENDGEKPQMIRTKKNTYTSVKLDEKVLTAVKNSIKNKFIFDKNEENDIDININIVNFALINLLENPVVKKELAKSIDKDERHTFENLLEDPPKKSVELMINDQSAKLDWIYKEMKNSNKVQNQKLDKISSTMYGINRLASWCFAKLNGLVDTVKNKDKKGLTAELMQQEISKITESSFEASKSEQAHRLKTKRQTATMRNKGK